MYFTFLCLNYNIIEISLELRHMDLESLTDDLQSSL